MNDTPRRRRPGFVSQRANAGPRTAIMMINTRATVPSAHRMSGARLIAGGARYGARYAPRSIAALPARVPARHSSEQRPSKTGSVPKVDASIGAPVSLIGSRAIIRDAHHGKRCNKSRKVGSYSRRLPLDRDCEGRNLARSSLTTSFTTCGIMSGAHNRRPSTRYEGRRA